MTQALFWRIRYIQPTASLDSLDFDELPTRHGVPHARLGQRIYVLHDDEGGLLQGDDAQVVVVRLTVWKGLVSRPHGMSQAQGLVLPLAHLHRQDKDTPELSCPTDFQKDKAFPVGGTGKEPYSSQGAFSATCLNIHICLCAKENGDRRKADYCAAPGPGLSPD